MTWNLPQRVKRLSLPSYRYTGIDFDHFEMVVAEDDRQTTIGIAAWEPADAKDAPAGHTALLLHGIYLCRSFISASRYWSAAFPGCRTRCSKTPL